jgi:hypothetical protein
MPTFPNKLFLLEIPEEIAVRILKRTLSSSCRRKKLRILLKTVRKTWRNEDGSVGISTALYILRYIQELMDWFTVKSKEVRNSIL